MNAECWKPAHRIWWSSCGGPTTTHRHQKNTSRIDDEDEDGAKSGMVRSFQVHGIAIWLGRYGNDRFAQQLGRNQ